jgi:hypothetical protein
MVWKQVVNADAGTADLAGGNDWDKLMQQLSGTDNDSVKLPVDYIDLNVIAEPASPSTGYIRLYMDTADSKIKIKRSNGEVVTIE